MRLKTLELKGFKSFAEDTVIHFNESVTGIVGPNGSGKSNIVDAIRWVLGEQKGRELRLEAMGDIIFNGTKKRKPAPVASVSLTFENNKGLLPIEYQEVNVSRHLYRSGESEYRLNNVTCRLKDITGLLSDTGIGSDSYAIIALGMVDDILANKDNARRKMFEQAAGISKYKTRKKESLNKLKGTEEDLARVEDILFEINNNLKELEKQARRAKRYFEIKEKYKQFSLVHAYKQNQGLNENYHSLQQQINDEIAKYEKLESSHTLKDAELEKIKKDNIDQERGLSDYQKQVNALLDQIRTIENEINISKQNIQFLTSQNEKMRLDFKTNDAKEKDLATEINSIEERNSEANAALEIISAQTETAHQAFIKIQEEYNNIKSGVDQKAREKEIQERRIYQIEKEIAVIVNRIENLQAEKNRRNDEYRTRQTELQQIESELSAFIENVDAMQKGLDNLQVKDLARLDQLKATREKYETVNKTYQDTCRHRDAKKNEYELLKNMVEKLEGFPDSIKYLYQHWKADVPVLTDVIYTKESYRAAIEQYLETYLNYFIVAGEQEALRAIKILGNAQKGKANFFILDKVAKVANSPSATPGCINAMDVVETDPQYQSLIKALLHNVYIQTGEEDLDALVKLSDDKIIISQSGSVIRHQHSISGGSIGLFEGKKIGRKKNLEKLGEELSEYEAKVKSLESEIQVLRNKIQEIEAVDLQKEISSKQQELIHLNQRKYQLESRTQHLQDFIQQTDLRNNSATQEIEQIQSEKSQKEVSVKEIQSNLEMLDSNLGSSGVEFDSIASKLSESSFAYNQLNIEMLKQQNRVENLMKDAEFKQTMRNEILQQIERDQQKIENQTIDIENFGIQLKENETRIVELYTNKKDLESNMSEFERSYYEIKNSINEKENELRTLQRNIQQCQILANQLKEQRSHLNYQMTSNAERVKIEFKTDLNTFEPDTEILSIDEFQLADQISTWKNRLDNYGEINPLALEAYDEMKGRHDQIDAQKQDILKAKDSLLETIKEIEETATGLFMTAFNEIRGHFQLAFRSLFTAEDDCDLILVNPSNPLESDIEITAKPKGKRPKSIHQLSGGEKTLTATALLFSLYLLKPAPFCIFDEVDAPLDDINIEKFNNIIRQFSKSSQFILITHNKLTMAEVDVLYGVYMEEQGISNVAPVDFRKYEHSVVLENVVN